MAFRLTDGPISLPAAADLSSSIHTFVSINSSGQAAATGIGAKPFGLLDNAPTAGKQARVDYEPGIYKVVLGGTVAPGDECTVDGSSKGIKAVSSGGVKVGTFVTGGVAGDIVSLAYTGYQGTI